MLIQHMVDKKRQKICLHLTCLWEVRLFLNIITLAIQMTERPGKAVSHWNHYVIAQQDVMHNCPFSKPAWKKACNKEWKRGWLCLPPSKRMFPQSFIEAVAGHFSIRVPSLNSDYLKSNSCLIVHDAKRDWFFTNHSNQTIGTRRLKETEWSRGKDKNERQREDEGLPVYFDAWAGAWHPKQRAACFLKFTASEKYCIKTHGTTYKHN